MNRRLSPLATDALFVVVLGVIALAGFHATFSGPDFLIAGLAGLVLGAGLAYVAVRLGQPTIVLAVFVVATFFLLGGAAALHGLGGLSWLPVPHTLSTLTKGSIDGWKDLLTTLPPVDSGVLLTIPYLLGLVGGAAGTVLAGRLKHPIFPTLAPVAVLIAVILLGAQRPGSVALTAGIFFVTLLAWLVIRSRRTQISTAAPSRLRRTAAAVGLVAATAGLAVVAGPHLPGVSSDRYVLRSQIVPPFNIGQYPSPLSSYRKYRPKVVGTLSDKLLFQVNGLSANSFMRIAALDSYDGTVWAASNDGTIVNGVPDTYQRVGTQLTSDATGPSSGPVHVTVAAAYADPGTATDVWIPTAGSLTSISFSSPPPETVAEQLRYNLATQTAILPGALHPGDSYTFTSIGAEPVLATPTMAAWTGAGAVTCTIAQCQTVATKLAGGGSTPMQQVFALAASLKDKGRLSDGVGEGQGSYTAGHSLYRLNQFTQYDAGLMVGDGEQYAATMALLVNQLGVPARVVVGAVPEPNGDVYGKDLQAWVEVELADGTWAYLPQSVFTSTNNQLPKLNTPQQQTATAQQIPAPLPLRPPANATSPLDDGASPYAHQNHNWWSGILHWIWVVLKDVVFPIGLILALCWSIIWAKRRRGRHRRSSGAPAEQLAGAWREYLDRVRDHGHTVPPRATRREQAAAIPVPASVGLARAADNHIFGAAEPTPDAVDDYWAEMEEAIGGLSTGLPRWRRIVIALNPVSLVPRRWRDDTGAALRSVRSR